MATTVSLMLLDHAEHFLLGLLAGVGLAHQEDHAVIEQIAELVEGRQLAAALESGIDRQDAMVMDGRLQQQIAQILGEHTHRVGFGPVGQLAADFPLQAGQNQAGQRIARAAAQIIGVGMARRNDELLRSA